MEDIYWERSGLGKYQPPTTSTSVNNCYISWHCRWGKQGFQPPVSCIPSFWPFYLGFLPLDLFLIAKIILTSTSPASHPFRTPTSYPFLFCLLTQHPLPTYCPPLHFCDHYTNVSHCLCLSLPSASISNEFSQKNIKCTHYKLPQFSTIAIHWCLLFTCPNDAWICWGVASLSTIILLSVVSVWK